MKRRQFLKSSALLSSCAPLLSTGCWGPAKRIGKKMIVLGIDGMDIRLTRKYMRQGWLPNFSTLAEKGDFRTLASSNPAQSPVAWSNFAVGARNDVHGIYDFIHRDPQTMIPYLSSSKVLPPAKTFNIADWQIPLGKGKTENLRKGKPFWEYLEDYDIPTTIFKIPANFPCKSAKTRMVSGMGTPDLRGGYGHFTLFTTVPYEYKKDMTGGMVVPLTFMDQKAHTYLYGPENTLHRDKPESKVPIEIWRDVRHPIARVMIQNREILLLQGEWTDWIQIAFPMIGNYVNVKGIVKFYCKSVGPDFQLYVTPINIDPSDPVFPVITPRKYANELIENVGLFYTQGFPEDTKALSDGVFSENEYLDLAYQIIQERKKILSYELKRFNREKNGMLFFYLSSLDQDSHMYWRTFDRYHPLYDEDLHQAYGHTLPAIYEEMDKMLGMVLTENDINDPEVSLVVMSDHGFAPFRRQVNINTWLFNNEYLKLKNSQNIENRGYFENVNWSQTSAYSLGINSIYLNKKGREKNGYIDSGNEAQLVKSIREDLLNLVDPVSGKKVVSRVWTVPETEKKINTHAPDLLVGWNYGYRTSWESILGGFSEEIVFDNLEKWSGDHCIDPKQVPAVLFTNKKVTSNRPDLCDLTATILAEFGITDGHQLVGENIFET